MQLIIPKFNINILSNVQRSFRQDVTMLLKGKTIRIVEHGGFIVLTRETMH